MEGRNTMKNARLLLSLSIAAAAFLYTSAMAIAAEHEHAMKVGKTGEVAFSQETRVGDLTLKPGRYQLQHRVEGSDHFIHFTELVKNTPLYPTSAPKAHPGEMKCRLEPMDKKVSQTTIYTTAEGKAERITRVEIAGENVAHLF
jgi:hypothetical protein